MRTSHLQLWFESGEDSLSVRRFAVREAISELFVVTVWARSPNHDLDLEAIIGRKAALNVSSGWSSELSDDGGRRWTGVCNHIEQLQPEPTGLSTYQLRIVPSLWLLTQRRNLRIFQHLSAPEIAARILAEWDIEPVWRLDRAAYPALEYKVQYDESDFAFVSRVLEEAGIAFVLEDDPDAETRLVLSDKLHAGELRGASPIPYFDRPNRGRDAEYVTNVRIAREVRPGAYTLRDYDFRNPGFPLAESATPAPPEERYEQYHYRPGSFLVEVDKGVARSEPRAGEARAERALQAERAPVRVVSFSTNAVDLRPGVILSIVDHPRSELAETERLLVTEAVGEGDIEGTWSISCRVVFADMPFRPPEVPKPRLNGVQSAMVVGPPGQEIHTDEFGRVRVQFPWDREAKGDDSSSCWMRVGQGWAGTGFGIITIPRVGQEVLVGFLDGDPEQPIIVGRMFNARTVVPYRLPENKTVSTWRSESTPGGGGYNEILFDDAKRMELVGIRAERDLRKLVKRDETTTVGRHRKTLVKGDEIETTHGDQVTFVGGDRTRLVKGDEVERIEGSQLVRVGKDQDTRILGARREQIDEDSHIRVQGSRRQRVDKTQSLTVKGDRFEKVGQRYALEAGEEIHVKAGTALVIEADDLTLRGPGGFVRIDAGGVTIKGTLVKINSAGGSAGVGSGASPEEPAAPAEATVEEPEMDDVSKTGHGP